MKHFIKSVLILALSIPSLFLSCVSNTRLKASNAKILQLQKDSINTANQLAIKNLAISTQKLINEEKLIAEEKKIAEEKANKKTIDIPKVEFVPFPPTIVSNKFNITYTDAAEVFWFRDNSITDIGQTPNKVYKVKFLINKINNSLIYNEDGNIIETRVQILPAQLPPNIYQAIKAKHPLANIISAQTYRNTSNNGTYAAIIQPTNNKDELEVVLTEKGFFVK
jgi:hypothetical protein